MNQYLNSVMASVNAKNRGEDEFLQAVEEVLETLSPVLENHPEYVEAKIIDRMVEPERTIIFRVPWFDDAGNVQVNRGFRVEFNSAIGPYKGGTRFHASVNLGSLKFLGFEQTFKNALTGLPLGGGKGGADFQFRGRTDNEIMRFCQSYMTALFDQIGPTTDVPAGDIGVGAREIGYLFGQYKRLTRTFDGTMTGKGLNWGGSRLRPEATGYGVAYFTEEMLKCRNESLDGKIVTVSGFGNVAWGAVQKVTEMGGKVVTLSGPDGFVYDPDGVSGAKIGFMQEMRFSGLDEVKQYADRFDVEFHAGKRPWVVPCDVAMPCAIQNELDEQDATSLLANGCQCITEGANMPSTAGAVHKILEAGILYGPGKAANAGGVAVSGLEMSQNGMRLSWSREEVDKRLHDIMISIHETCRNTAEEYGKPGNYVLGANISGFLKVADAMMDQGLV